MINPQLDNEVRGLDNLRLFGKLLFEGYTPEWAQKDASEKDTAASTDTM